MIEILVTNSSGFNVLVDLNGDETFTINYEIANVQNISASNGAYTKALEIPNTPKNRQLFDFIDNLAVSLTANYFNPNLKRKCYVLEDGVIILDGYIQLNSITIEDLTVSQKFGATIFGVNSNFFIQLGDSLLSDLDFSAYDFTFNENNITSSWRNDPNSWQLGYYCPLIDYGGGLSLDDANTGKLTVNNFLPAIYVKTIWDKIFQNQNINYDSNFLSSDERFTGLVIPFSLQAFQNPNFNQDKIFHVGLTQNTIGQYYHNSMGVYPNQTVVFNYDVAAFPSNTNAWFDGIMLSPFQSDPNRNTYGNSGVAYTYDQLTVPFSNIDSPMFDTTVGGVDTYNTSSFYYQNASGDIFKQRFVLKTDVVTTYSIERSPSYLDYVIFVEFFREIDPATGLVSPAWATGTGARIPPDLGGAGSIGYTNERHWICDPNKRSNVFDVNGTLIVPVADGGRNRYLGKYCTTDQGHTCIEADGVNLGYYRQDSGNCITHYYNDGFNCSGRTDVVPLWASGTNPSLSIGGSGTVGGITDQPDNGDWYQQLIMQTIFLDGNTADPKYGIGGSLVGVFGANSNKPIQPGEKVRVNVTFGGQYPGQGPGVVRSYKPPSVCYLLTYTAFDSDLPYPNGPYQNPEIVNRPLTQFYNEVANDYIDGQTIHFNDIIPQNLKQKDFVLDVINIHNLYIEPSKTKNNTLIQEPRDEYYGRGSTLDWTNKVDLTKPITVQILAETQNRTTIFNYKSDSDWYNKQYTQETNENYGQFVFSIDNDFLNGEKKIESLFSPTPLVQLHSVFSTGGGSLNSYGGFIIPSLVSGSNVTPTNNEGPKGSIQTNYRILMRQYIQNQNTEQIYIFGTQTHYYPYAGPYYPDPYNPTYTLNWGGTKGEFFNVDTSSVDGNLVNNYWASLLTELNDVDSKIIKCSMYLTPIDINGFYFYNQVLVNINGADCICKVNSIENYIPGQNTTCDVTLLKTNLTI